MAIKQNQTYEAHYELGGRDKAQGQVSHESFKYRVTM